jgi:S-adenosylmethionine:tRNA ribosyltransferase-isomerase
MSEAAGYTFELPAELIAQDPPAERGASRLLVAERHGRVLGIRPFADLADLLRPGDLLVINDSRVLPARLRTRRVDTGGRIELLLVRPSADDPSAWEAMARPARRLRPGQELQLLGDDPQLPTLTITGRLAGGEVMVAAPPGHDLVALAEAHGEVPLPPYIRRDADHPEARPRQARDRVRYQTVYARDDRHGVGSVAAPTAGLHFGHDLLASLQDAGVGVARVTLHVGPGTFQSPSLEQISAGRLHPEAFEFPSATWDAVARCRASAGRVVAVGTTSLRVLATVSGLGLPARFTAGDVREVADGGDGPPVFQGRAEANPEGWSVRGATRLFLQPPAMVDAADALVTNFHLPGSSLLMLVAAFGGEQLWREAYREAVASRLRFYSYGDAMIMLPPGGHAS